MDCVRIILVASPAAPVRALADRLDAPTLDVLVCGSAKDALAGIRAVPPDVLIVDGSLPTHDVTLLYGSLRASTASAQVPLILTGYDDARASFAARSSQDYVLDADATLDDVEQLVFSFLPASLVEDVDEAETDRDDAPDLLASVPLRPDHPEQRPASPPPAPASPDLAVLLNPGPQRSALMYAGAYCGVELLGAAIDARLGLIGHAGLLLVLFFHGAQLSPGSERALFWTLWLAPLTRIYALAQPYAGAPPLAWWALTAIPMVVAGVVAMRLAGLSRTDAGLAPTPREAPVAITMVPVGLALGLLLYVLVEPRNVGWESVFGGAALVAVIALVNPGIVDEIVFRGVLQRGAVGVLGGGVGLIYVSVLSAPVIPAGLLAGPSLTATVFMFGVGLLLAMVTARTGSVLGASAAHVGLALGLTVLGPALLPNGLGLASPPPAAPATTDILAPAPKPAVIVASPGAGPGQTGAPVQPGSASPAGGSGQPGPLVPPGQSSPPSLPGLPAPSEQPAPGVPTAITLAPPLPPPAVVSPAPAVPPGATGAPTGQVRAAVVRGTGGSGARLRAQPGNGGQIVVVLPENTPLLIIGADRTVDGAVWRNVRAPNGAEGWMAAPFVSTGQ